MHNSIRNENDYHAVFESTFRHRQTYYIDTKEISDNRVCWEFSGFFFNCYIPLSMIIMSSS